MKYKIAVFAGDGVGPEIIEEGKRIIEKAAELDKFEVEWVNYHYSANHYAETKEIPNGKSFLEIKNSCNAIYCGPFDKINDEKKIIFIPNLIKDYFSQTISIRPIKLFPKVKSPINVSLNEDINFTVIKENFEDFYAGIGSFAKSGKNKDSFDFEGASKAKFNVNVEVKSGEISYNLGI